MIFVDQITTFENHLDVPNISHNKSKYEFIMNNGSKCFKPITEIYTHLDLSKNGTLELAPKSKGARKIQKWTAQGPSRCRLQDLRAWSSLFMNLDHQQQGHIRLGRHRPIENESHHSYRVSVLSKYGSTLGNPCFSITLKNINHSHLVNLFILRNKNELNITISYAILNDTINK